MYILGSLDLGPVPILSWLKPSSSFPLERGAEFEIGEVPNKLLVLDLEILHKYKWCVNFAVETASVQSYPWNNIVSNAFLLVM